jgi:N,N-dimethylformamidase
MARRRVNHQTMPAVGFVEPWSFQAGASAALHLSSDDPSPHLRVVHLDKTQRPVPAIGWELSSLAPIGARELRQGSWIEIPLPQDRLRLAHGLRFHVECLLTRNPTPRTLLRLGSTTLRLLPDGILLHDQTAVAHSGQPPWANQWMRITLTVDADGTHLEIDQDDRTVTLALPATGDWRAQRLCLGGDEASVTVNARFARPVLVLDGQERAAWQFPSGPPVDSLLPESGDWPPLTIHNRPTFSMTSRRWDGSIHDPRLDPTQYDALHCHDDDMAPLDWPETHHIRAHENAEPGVYAVEVETVSGIERIPFFLRARVPQAPLVFLVPTLTYLAYADESLPQALFPWVCDDRGNRFAQDNGLVSLYDRHSDGSGVSLTTTRRVKATLRDDHVYPLSGSPHLLPVDLQLLRFCREAGIAFDLVTDHDLHEQGVAALSHYRGVFTGSHPEYWTTAMQDGLRDFVDGGGSLAYLGGNGLMWVTGVQGELMEIRRGQGLGARTWDGHPGESNLSLTGEVGGLWRERGRSEFSVIGTGMTMMGFGKARPYRRRVAKDTQNYAWIFEGVAESSFGETGTVLGGAAGYEVDRTDSELGTHPDTVVLAVATGFDVSYATDPNEFFPTPADREKARVAEMVIRRTPQGGLIFGTGSVAWCGALSNADGMTAVGQITANALRKFTSP